MSSRIKTAPIPIIVLFVCLSLQPPASGRQSEQAAPWIRDVTDVIRDLGLERLPGPPPVIFPGGQTGLREEAHSWQVAMLEAAAFWRNLLGAMPGGGLAFVDSPTWVAMHTDRSFGFPATLVTSADDGLLVLLPVDASSTYSEFAAETVVVAPLRHRGLLLAYGLASVEGAAEYARAWVWVHYAEQLAGSLRIGTEGWWQRRLVGATAAWMFLESPRGKELAPGRLEALEAWSGFWRGYLNPVAVGLESAAASPPSGDPRTLLEMDARLLEFGRDIWREYATGAFTRFRTAWPFDAEPVEMQEKLDALLEQMPRLEPWRDLLLNPREPEPPPEYIIP